ncbi:hypothetical protein ERUR111494_04845 [Erysipelothrix urinaevulpis]|uniref:hypothetical protein n=1 Tax=Erysipelothrix urinaevulpis TaxID=2683717 RepID=UPI001357D747|nr:hypothetical protein [Erysipelothrix urinaevulpis]
MIAMVGLFLIVLTGFRRKLILNILRTEQFQRHQTLLNEEPKKCDHTLITFWILSLFVLIVTSFKMGLYSLLVACFVMMIPYLKIKSKVKVLKEKIDYEFPIWMNQVHCLLQSNTVLNALEKSVSRAPVIISNDLEILIKKLHDFPNDLSAFELFLKDFDNWNIKTAMHYLYRHNFIASEDDEGLLNLTKLISEWLDTSRKKKQKQAINQKTFIIFIPMLIVSFLFMFMMYLVMHQMMEGGCC